MHCVLQTDHDPRNPAYICTQGPLPHTVADFWQMVWEQGSVVIVMLSKYVCPFVPVWIVLKYSPLPRLTENGYQLCHRYWPEEGSEQYHIFEVRVTSVLSHPRVWKYSNVNNISHRRSTWCLSTCGARTTWSGPSTSRTTRRGRPGPWLSSTSCPGQTATSPPPPSPSWSSDGQCRHYRVIIIQLMLLLMLYLTD